MSRIIKPAELNKAIETELTTYHKNVIERVDNAGEAAIKMLVKRTKERAPVDTGTFKKHISSKAIVSPTGTKSFVWYVKAPYYRLTHLLVHGHAKSTGGRVPGDSFLQDSLDEILPEYENSVKEALKNDR